VWSSDYPFPCEFDAEENGGISSSRARGTTWLVPVAGARSAQPEMVAMFQEEFTNSRKTHHKNGHD